MNTTTTKLHAISDDLGGAVKSMKGYSTSATNKKIENMDKSSKKGTDIHYDESTNPFVQIYRWFAGTPWDNFEERMKKYGLELDDIIAHLERNAKNFKSDKESTAEMKKMLDEMGSIINTKENETTQTREAAGKAKEDIGNILDSHLEKIAKEKIPFAEANAVKARIRSEKAAVKYAKNAQDTVDKARTNFSNNAQNTVDKARTKSTKKR